MLIKEWGARWHHTARRWGQDLLHRGSFQRSLRLRAKLIGPYALLTLLVALLGTFVTVRLVTGKWNERFHNALAEAGRVAEDGLVRQEAIHLEYLRQMAFTQGVADALAQGDAARLSELLQPLVSNHQVDAVTAVDADGSAVLTLAYVSPAASSAAPARVDLSAFEPVAGVLRGEMDTRGDKYAGLLLSGDEAYLFTVAPVKDRAGARVGALMIGTRLQTLLAQLHRQSLADLVVLDPGGRLIATTLTKTESDDIDGLLQLPASTVADVDTLPARPLTLYGRQFEVLYSTLEVRQRPVGVLGVVLSRDYVVATENVSRDTLVALFGVLVLAVMILGFLLARAITQPILRLREISQAVAAGDLDQETGLRQTDEIGDLAAAFDQMTLRLRERTQEAARLYDETVRRNTELTEAYDKLKRAQQQLIQSEKLGAIGQLTAGIVHDVKNPLAAIKGMAELMQETPNLDPQQQQNAASIIEHTNRANRIVGDLLKFARQSAREMVPGDLRATVETVVRLNGYLARQSKVQMTTDLPAQSVMAIYDPGQIEQVLVNLIQNAIQAMPNGGRLRINVSQTSQTVAVAVQDTGTGIAPENLGRIFDPFFTTKPAGEGTGLGLAVSYGIVASHGGKIDVVSTLGAGTTFTVLLPIDPPPLAKEGAGRILPLTPATRSTGGLGKNGTAVQT
jgi:two-component system NtrC family sensor kinase